MEKQVMSAAGPNGLSHSSTTSVRIMNLAFKETCCTNESWLPCFLLRNIN